MSFEPALGTTPLHAAHRALGAKLVPFAGFEMPVQYTGIMAESRAVRSTCGMFDVSHMGRLEFWGPDTLEFLELVTSNDVCRLTEMTGQYSLLPNETGGCVDDIILYRLADRFQMVVNASNHAKVVEWLKSHAGGQIELRDITDESCLIAVQGPEAQQVLGSAAEPAGALEGTSSFGVVQVRLGGIEVQAARSGYTGEDGFELTCAAGDAESLWGMLLEKGVLPCGLGARDTLRVEAGLPLYGHELGEEMSPVSAGLNWAIGKTKQFLGCEAIRQVQASGATEKLMGIRLDIKRLVPPGTKVQVVGDEIGSVSSGIVSPTFDTALALAFLLPSVKTGTSCDVLLRGNSATGTVCTKRFYKRSETRTQAP